MSTYREVTYMILDELKLTSDDSYFEEEHVLYLMDKYRAAILKQRYNNKKNIVNLANFQDIYLPLTRVPAISGEPCEGGDYLKSSAQIPSFVEIGYTKVYPIDFYYQSAAEITYVSRERMRYVGYNRYLKNIIYCSIGPDKYLYFKSSNPQFLNLEKAKMVGVFADTIAATNLYETSTCELLNITYPLEDSLVPTVVMMVVKDLLGAAYRPTDGSNDGADNMSNLASFLASNLKPQAVKNLSGQQEDQDQNE